MGRLRFGPARVPDRSSPEAAVERLLERNCTAVEIDFESEDELHRLYEQITDRT